MYCPAQRIPNGCPAAEYGGMSKEVRVALEEILLIMNITRIYLGPVSTIRAG